MKIYRMMGLAVFFLLGSSFMSGAFAKTILTNTQCPVMTKERAKEKYYADYKGERVYLCCKSCIRKFNKNPEKYWARLHPAS